MERFRFQFGFIGMGNMGYAMMKGLLRTYRPEELTFSNRSKEKSDAVTARTDVAVSADNRACAQSSRYLVLAVKPQQYRTVIDEIKDVITQEQIVISIAPGITVADLAMWLGKNCRIVRAMPNTPALVGEGMTGVCYDATQLSEKEQDTIRGFFEAFGKMAVVDEKLMDAVVCASGSSPAYVYIFIEALADSAVKYGIPRATAYELVAQTVLGSAKMLLETKEHPGSLKDKVCSPGGTTIAGVAALEEHGFRNALIKATDACYAKCGAIK